MPFFAELLDTGRNERSELDMAKTLLMLGSLKPTPFELATIHAINSTLLLDECGDPAFHDLVIHGRIRFRWVWDSAGRPRSPRQEFCERIGRERYFLAWPETYEKASHGGFRNLPDLCDAVRRILEGDRTTTGIATLDTRIANAEALFRAIEQSKYQKLELPRQGIFTDSLRLVVDDVPHDEEHRPLRDLVAALGRIPSLTRRAEAYDVIESSADGVLVAQAKDVVDAVYNHSVAHSLEADWLSTRRVVPLGNGFRKTRRSSRASLHYTEDIASETRLKPLVDRNITWKAVADAVARRPPVTEYAALAAREDLANALAGKTALLVAVTPLTAAVGAGVGLAAAAALPAIGFAGALAGWAHAPLAMLGAGIFAQLKGNAAAALQKTQAGRIRKELDGWLDMPE